jgi:predicted Zn finger-like uncharacterized protein
MALATKCPHCGTVFKVAADQLKLRGGIVRCGKCSEIFDGNAALVDPEAALHRHLPASEADEPAPGPAPEEEEIPVYTLDFDTTLEPLGIIPKADSTEEASEPESPAAAPAPQLDIDFDLDLVPPPSRTESAPFFEPAPEAETESAPESESESESESEPEQAPEPEPAPTLEPETEPETEPEPEPEPEFEPTPEPELEPAPEQEPELSPVIEPEPDLVAPPVASEDATEPADVQGTELVPGAMATESAHAEEPVRADDDVEEPGFVTRVRKKEKATRITRILMAIGSVLLLAAVLAQGVITFGSVLAARYPQAKPALSEACKLLRCQIALPAQIDTLSVETGELQSIANGTFLFATVLRNDSTLVQTWPHIELALTDTADKTLVRRVIKPAEYLPPRTDTRRGFPAKTEQQVKVYFKLNGVTASGYHIAIFHP